MTGMGFELKTFVSVYMKWQTMWCMKGLGQSADENYFTKPPRMKKIMKSRPSVVFAQTSPYPTVDIVTMSKYTHSQYESG